MIGHLHVEAAAVAAASSLTQSSRASHLLLDVRAVGAVQGRASIRPPARRRHCCAAMSLTLAARVCQLQFWIYALWMWCRVRPLSATCTSTALLWPLCHR